MNRPDIGRVPVSALPMIIVPLGVATLAMLASRYGAPSGASWDIAWTAAAVSAVVGMCAARARAQAECRARWTLWALGAGFWLAGQVVWDLYGVIGFPQSPHLADVCWWTFALLVILSMLTMPSGPRALRMIAAVESIGLITSAVAVCLAALLPIASTSTLPTEPKIAALVYPVLYVSATVLTLQAMVGGGLRGLRSKALQLVLGGIAAQALAFILWSYELLQRSYVVGRSPLDPLWVLGLAGIAIGGLVAARDPEQVARVPEPGFRAGLLPAGLFGFLLLAVVRLRLNHAAPGTMITLEVGLLFSGAAIVARSALLGRRMRLLLERERAAIANLAEREAELARLNAQLVEDSRRDPLTGISNRRALSDDLPVLESAQRQGGTSVAFALCDVDHFKPYNDRFGHLAGDQALRSIAVAVRGALRTGDTAYRFGGEELLLILRGADLAEAAEVAHRVRAAVERAAIPHPGSAQGILTVSIGVAAGEEEPSRLLAGADGALYEAKRQGRNCVVVASEASPLPAPGWTRSLRSEDPVPRHLRSMLAVSRAAAAGRGPIPVLEALAETIHTELSFQVVVVNLADEDRKALRVVIVRGDQDAHDTLMGTSTSWQDWQRLLEAGENICGAVWLEAGSYEWDDDAVAWIPPAVPAPTPDAWHPEDMLLLPLRGAAGELLAIVSVDQPLLGRRPDQSELSVLMTVADHAGLALEQAQRVPATIAERSPALAVAMELLSESLDVRDPGTAEHSRRVGEWSRDIAVELGLDVRKAQRLHAAGLLHDLGKLGVSEGTLRKPRELDEGEWREVKAHVQIGARILEKAGAGDIAAWVREHHERVDGSGYPDGLADEDISLEARILAVADAYEAMVGDRPYRRAMTHEQARAELLRCAGTQFDQGVVEAFLRVLEAQDMAQRLEVERVA
jgi:diguanylate cyclase (GGDEF)-like protein